MATIELGLGETESGGKLDLQEEERFSENLLVTETIIVCFLSATSSLCARVCVCV